MHTFAAFVDGGKMLFKILGYALVQYAGIFRMQSAALTLMIYERDLFFNRTGSRCWFQRSSLVLCEYDISFSACFNLQDSIA